MKRHPSHDGMGPEQLKFPLALRECFFWVSVWNVCLVRQRSCWIKGVRLWWRSEQENQTKPNDKHLTKHEEPMARSFDSDPLDLFQWANLTGCWLVWLLTNKNKQQQKKKNTKLYVDDSPCLLKVTPKTNLFNQPDSEIWLIQLSITLSTQKCLHGRFSNPVSAGLGAHNKVQFNCVHKKSRATSTPFATKCL